MSDFIKANRDGVNAPLHEILGKLRLGTGKELTFLFIVATRKLLVPRHLAAVAV